MIEQYIKVNERIHTNSNAANQMILDIIKLNYEIELKCFKQASRTFNNIISSDFITIEGWDMLVRGAFILGKLDELHVFYKLNEQRLKELDGKKYYTYLFLQYSNIKYGNLSSTSLEKFFKSSELSNNIKSFVCYINALMQNSEEGKKEFLQVAHMCNSENLTIIQELLSLEEAPKEFNVGNLIKSNLEDKAKLSRILNKLFELKNITSIDNLLGNFELCILGGGNTIGGSCYLIKFFNFNILIDVGVVFQGSLDSVPPDFELLKKFGLRGLEDIDFVIITHAHLDHCGGIVELYKQRPDIKIYATEETRQLMFKNIKSSLSKDISEDFYYLDKCIQSVVTLDFRKPFHYKKDDKYIYVELLRAGHILGASSIYLSCNDIGVFFTGDYCLEDQKTVEGMDMPEGYKVDVLVTENTYGKSNLKSYPRQIEEQLFITQIEKHMSKGSKVLIPAFALGRSQEIICLIKEYFSSKKQIPFRLYIDGLVVDMCEIYSSFINEDFKGRGIFFANKNQGFQSKDEFIENEVLHHKSCIVASSGMLKDGSASSTYLEKLVEDNNALCILTGYQDEESTGAILRQSNAHENRDAYIEINGIIHKKNIEIQEYYLSAHCKLEEILELAIRTKPKYVFLTHGNANKENDTEVRQLLSVIENLTVIQTYNYNDYKI